MPEYKIKYNIYTAFAPKIDLQHQLPVLLSTLNLRALNV